jgi:biopolymer transport protein ExbD
MKFRRNLKQSVDINLTPLIDMVFLLLIFFMVTTTFNRDGRLLVTLPEANGDQLQQTDLRIELIITEEGGYLVNGDELAGSDIETLKQALSTAGNGDVSIPITITADAKTTHQAVVTAMDAAAQLGFTKLNIATRQNGAAQ